MLDSRGEKTGEVAWKSEAHRLGLWHRCFHCWIFSPEISSGSPYLFVQRRAAGKDTWPNRLDVTAAGHLGAGEETLEGGPREIEEELGLTVAPDELVPLGTRRSELQIPAGLDREFQEVFLLVRARLPKTCGCKRKRSPPSRASRSTTSSRRCTGEARSLRRSGPEGKRPPFR